MMMKRDGFLWSCISYHIWVLAFTFASVLIFMSLRPRFSWYRWMWRMILFYTIIFIFLSICYTFDFASALTLTSMWSWSHQMTRLVIIILICCNILLFLFFIILFLNPTADVVVFQIQSILNIIIYILNNLLYFVIDDHLVFLTITL